MITRERLEELIKQGATIYHINGKSIKLNLKDGNIIPVWVCDLNELFETKDKAEWALKTTAERIERFEPPMWEDIDNFYKYIFISDNGKMYCSFVVNKEYAFIAIDKDLCDYYRVEATKENYIKACEIVRDLFNKGETK